MGQKTYNFDVIEREIADVFRRLGETMPNASFVYSYVYATDKDPTKAEAKGRINMRGAKEEISVHLTALQEMLAEEEKKGHRKRDKIYGTKKD